MADGPPFFMRDPRRVLAVLGWVTGCATVFSIIAYWTHSLALATVMFWVFIPAIYFFIGPCMALVLNLAPSHMRSTFTAWSVLVGNVFNLIVAPQVVGILSDWYGGAHGRRRCRLAALGAAGARAHRLLGDLALRSGGADGRSG